jgi:hypothetical protein
MTNSKFASGAFVFNRAKGLEPKNPEEILPIAQRHGIDPSVIPPYAGDRAAISRAIQHTSTKVAGETYLLRPIRRNSTEVTYGIVKEDSHNDHLDHNHESTVRWTMEPDSSAIEGTHTIANRIRESYQHLRGKLVTEDFTACTSSELERLGAVAMRDDGRVHWVAPSSLDDVRRLQGFLEEIGITLFVAEVESQNTGTITEVVAESVEDQLARLEKEVEDFSETQKPSMFARRLSEYQKLKQKALLYQSALGIGAERTVQVLSELETKVSVMLDIRNGMTVHKDGSVTKKGEKAVKGDSAVTPVKQGRSKMPAATLTFAGAKFNQADSDKPDEMLFTSGDEHAISSVRALESMGLAGKFQRAGSAEVSIQNSGPEGQETSIRLRLVGGGDLATAGKALEGLGITVGS